MLADRATVAGDAAGAAPRAFLSWAHRHARWADSQAQEWARTVADFAYLLRTRGVDVDVDFFHYTERGIDWTRYGPDSILAAETVLIASSEAYWERWEGRNDPTEGAGVAREADTLKGLFNADQAAFQRKVLIVELPGQTGVTVPYELRRVPCYPIPDLSVSGVEALLRLLHRAPRYPRTPVARPPALPAYTPRTGTPSEGMAPPATTQPKSLDRMVVEATLQRHRREPAG